MDYEYKKKNGESISCYGKLMKDSKIFIYCEDKWFYSVKRDTEAKTWHQVCKNVETRRNDVVQLVAV